MTHPGPPSGQSVHLSEAHFHVWSRHASRRVFGARLSVRANSAVWWDDVLVALPPGRSEAIGEKTKLAYSIVWDEASRDLNSAEHRLCREDSCLYAGPDPEELINALQSDATLGVATMAREGLFIHAGAVSYQGRGLLLPGTSGAGKSTLVTKLLGFGADYYSDEYGVIDADGLLSPFPTLVRLRNQPGGKSRNRPDSFGAQTGNTPVRVGLVAFPRFMNGAEPRTREMSPGQAALHLLEHIPAARDAPELALTAAAQVAGGARCCAIEYDDSNRAAEFLLRVAVESPD